MSKEGKTLVGFEIFFRSKKFKLISLKLISLKILKYYLKKYKIKIFPKSHPPSVLNHQTFEL